MLVFTKVPDPERFGVPVFDDSGALVDVLESRRIRRTVLRRPDSTSTGRKCFRRLDHIEKARVANTKYRAFIRISLKTNTASGIRKSRLLERYRQAGGPH